ncbi:CoA transferase [Mycobacterium sp. CVI_P3]|uniref:CoA transferase n=1 Tax=Mycobacterium pinniadriaticum TaxID=2994102 RepID=A0ABT3SCB8_9MYCO|nr:CoA transferase [Mycobacterium pinniadriaticum]MCX2930593.1 CoA transferase [Mycobacterium pinniadriaticum]MCX2937017.1 CoA transferase [Mycobacterium pinniadriaticum]
MSHDESPLSGVRVIDMTDGVAGGTGRFLAQLGADVILVEPPQGVASRRQEPMYDGHGLRFATAHCNKRGVVIDVTEGQGREELLKLVEGSDIVLESHAPGVLERYDAGPRQMLARNTRLVVASLTNFGQRGPQRDWKASEPVFTAMSAMLTRSGAPGREPLLPPGGIASETAAVHAAFAVLLAYYNAMRTGVGDYVDCAILDLVLQGLDPGFGVGGSATMGQPQINAPHERPDRRMLYPIIACSDGHVRMFIASAKQWRALFGWLGEPSELADPALEQMFSRLMHWDKIQAALADMFKDQTRAEIVRRGTELGIAVASLHTAREVLDSDHVRVRNAFLHTEVAPGLTADIANGYVQIGGRRAGFRRRAPGLGEHTVEVRAESRDGEGGVREAATVDRRRPLSGLRVLDLGVIVVGAETGRLLADQGAEVIKVENRSFLDGLRQFDQPTSCSYTAALGNRGKRSLGVNLRSDSGKDLFKKLVAKSDVVLSNFKPGTLGSLGLGYESLRAVNPRIVCLESSALGSTGPWSNQMGYGPLVRATVGLTELWRHPDSPEAFGDDMTVYPDHSAARVGVAAVMAALIGRQRTGKGCKIELAQMETVFSQLATGYLRESLQPGTLVARGNVGEFDAPSDVFACEGEDAYCAIDINGDDEWIALANVLGRADLADDARFATAAGRVHHRAEIDAVVAQWTAGLSPWEVQSRLQAVGVPAGAAAHVADLLNNPQLKERGQLGLLDQPGFDEQLDVDMGPAVFDNIAAPELRPAPLMGADTRDICHDVLGMSGSEIDALLADGVLETVAE